MAKKTLQLYRGTTAQNNAYTGAEGEVTIDTETNQLRVHDGFTAGGHIIYTKSNTDTALSAKADKTTTYTKTDIDTALSAKANDNTVVHLDDTETISGDKSFSGSNSFTGTTDFSGTTTVVTQTTTDNSTKVATTAFVVDVLKAMYPVGAIFIGTQNTCPMAQFFGTWQIVATDRALWGGNGTNGNTTISAGLPNVLGYLTNMLTNSADDYYNGALSRQKTATGGNAGGGYPLNACTVTIDAHSYNSIYGNSTTVQPPAYRVNVWRRTA